jgi:hypothetical protein
MNLSWHALNACTQEFLLHNTQQKVKEREDALRSELAQCARWRLLCDTDLQGSKLVEQLHQLALVDGKFLTPDEFVQRTIELRNQQVNLAKQHAAKAEQQGRRLKQEAEQLHARLQQLEQRMEQQQSGGDVLSMDRQPTYGSGSITHRWAAGENRQGLGPRRSSFQRKQLAHVGAQPAHAVLNGGEDEFGALLNEPQLPAAGMGYDEDDEVELYDEDQLKENPQGRGPTSQLAGLENMDSNSSSRGLVCCQGSLKQRAWEQFTCAEGDSCFQMLAPSLIFCRAANVCSCGTQPARQRCCTWTLLHRQNGQGNYRTR